MASGFQESGAPFDGSTVKDPHLVALLGSDQEKTKLRFRETLIKMMETRRVTAAELARETGISKGTIDKLRQRKVEVTNAFDAMKIAMFFGKSVEQFFDVQAEGMVAKAQDSEKPRGRHPLFGCMAGTFWVDPTYDLTQPMYTDEEMDAFADAKADLMPGIQR